MKQLLQTSLFNKHFRRLKSQTKRKHDTGVNKLESITILAESPFHSASELDAATRHFRKLGKSCFGFLVSLDKDLSAVSDDIEYIHKNDVLWYGVPKQSTLIKWLSHGSDLLIILNPKDTPLMRYLCASSNSRLKAVIDYGHEKNDDIDFYLDTPDHRSKNARQLSSAIYDELKKIATA